MIDDIGKDKILVIIVTYNGEHLIEQCLRSIANSKCPMDVILIDNNSIDNTLDVVSKFKITKVIKNHDNYGFGKANNIGLRFGRDIGYDYVMLLNQDAEIEPDTVCNLVRISHENPNYGILAPIQLSNRKKIENNFLTYTSRCRQLISDVIIPCVELKKVYEICFVNAAVWLITRDCLLEVGGFDPIFPHYGEDNDYVNRVVAKNNKVGLCPDVFAYHYRGTSKESNMSIQRYINHYLVKQLVFMKDPRKTFSRQLVMLPIFTVKCLSASMNNSKVLKKMTAVLISFLIVIFMTIKIYNHREIDRKFGAYL